MITVIEDNKDIKRCAAKRKFILVVEVIKGKTSVAVPVAPGPGLIEAIRGRLNEYLDEVSVSQLLRWFGIPRWKVAYRPAIGLPRNLCAF